MRRLLPLAGPFYVFAGVMHFLIPKVYMRIMPRWLPAHRELVYASGVAEIAGGVALMHPDPKVRRLGAWFETATMVAVFPANVNMCLNSDAYPDVPGGRAALLARLPLQAGFIAWALRAGER
jgi:uncharacterized membrane protein